jgi:hypothetical protein
MNDSAPTPARRWPTGLGVVALSMAALGVCTSVLAWEIGAQEFVLTEEQFNQWLTNNNEGAAQQIDSQVKMHIAALDRVCKLSAEQREKLQLAGRGDAARFESQIAALRAELVNKSYKNQEINDVFQRIQPFQQKFQTGLLGDDSLFKKIVSRTLDQSQQTEYEVEQQKRREADYVARVDMYVAMVDRAAPMSDQQREELLALFRKHTRPPKQTGQQQIYYVMYQASKIPPEELKKVFDEAQLKVIEKAFRQGASYKNMLERQGFKFDEEEQEEVKKDANPRPQRPAPAAAPEAVG